jgi:selenocysteine lyase/cysteine desulfurase
MLSQLRSDTPGCSIRIHLNNAGASLSPQPVLQAIHQHITLESQIGGYEAADAVADNIAGFYLAVARLLNTAPHNISFAANATDAYARALSSIPFRAGDRILTTENDYVSNQIAFLSLQKRMGVEVVRARDTEAGGVDVDHLESLIRQHKPALVAVTHVPTNSGLVQPVEAIGRICRQYDVWYLVDACQSAGQLRLDVAQIGCDFLSATMRKYMRGPRGAGFLYVSDRALEAGLEMLLPDMRGAIWTDADTYQTTPDAKRFEYFEIPYALLLGSKAATDYALSVGMNWIEATVRSLAAHTRIKLAEISGVRVLDKGADLCGIVTCYSDAWQPDTLIQSLAAENINCRVSGGRAATIDFGKKGVPWALRISPHYYNTEDEINQAVALLKTITKH